MNKDLNFSSTMNTFNNRPLTSGKIKIGKRPKTSTKPKFLKNKNGLNFSST